MSYRQVPQPPAVARVTQPPAAAQLAQPPAAAHLALAAALLARDREQAREVLEAAGSPLGAGAIDAVVVPALTS